MEKNYLIKNIINNTTVYNLKTQTILQACNGLGIEIPRYCFHNRLSIAGNCRMCLVEIYGIEKPVASCAQQVHNGVHVLTNSEVVKRIREGISQFLLYNHPLDCAVCDQGGECDLQDQVMVYGTDKGRFYDYKRTVLDKECGPLIKTVMTRCIHCTRCVRFLQEVAGNNALGVLGRGQTMEIGGYLNEVINSELSGNLVDLCPVGALTSKPGAFNNRVWELRSIESIDIFDSVNSNIRVDLAFSDIVRITPIINNKINEEWITDKIRYAYDGLIYQRVGTPLLREGSSLISISWKKAMSILYCNLFNVLYKKFTMKAFISEQTGIKATHSLVSFFNQFGSSLVKLEQTSINNKNNINLDFIQNISLNIDLDLVSQAKDIILVGHNFKLDAPILNLKLRKSYLINRIKIYLIGTIFSSTFPLVHVGITHKSLFKFLNSRLISSSTTNLFNIFINNLSFSLNLLINLYKLINKLGLSIKVYCFNSLSNFVGISNYGKIILNNSLNFSTNILKKKLNIKRQEICYYFNTIDLIYNSNINSYNIYHGHHGHVDILSKVDLVLPSATFLEQSDLYSNLNNRLQSTQVAFNSSTEVRLDLDIFNVLSNYLVKISHDLGKSINKLDSLSNSDVKIFLDTKTSFNKSRIEVPNLFIKKDIKFSNSNILLSTNSDDFYKTDLITYSSKTMSNCSRNLSLKSNLFL